MRSRRFLNALNYSNGQAGGPFLAHCAYLGPQHDISRMQQLELHAQRLLKRTIGFLTGAVARYKLSWISRQPLRDSFQHRVILAFPRGLVKCIPVTATSGALWKSVQ